MIRHRFSKDEFADLCQPMIEIVSSWKSEQMKLLQQQEDELHSIEANLS
jgi:hypothetical protein